MHVARRFVEQAWTKLSDGWVSSPLELTVDSGVFVFDVGCYFDSPTLVDTPQQRSTLLGAELK